SGFRPHSARRISGAAYSRANAAPMPLLAPVIRIERGAFTTRSSPPGSAGGRPAERNEPGGGFRHQAEAHRQIRAQPLPNFVHWYPGVALHDGEQTWVAGIEAPGHIPAAEFRRVPDI